MLALTFKNPNDYDLIQEDDLFSFTNLKKFKENENLILKIAHKDGTHDLIFCVHTYNKSQIEWFKAGSALNLINIESQKELD